MIYYFATDEVSYDNLEEALGYLVDSAESLSDLLQTSVDEWECSTHSHSEYLNALDIFENAHERAYCETDYADDYLYEVMHDKKLIQEFDNMIAEFLKKHNVSSPSWYTGNVHLREIPVTVELLNECGVDYQHLK